MLCLCHGVALLRDPNIHHVTSMCRTLPSNLALCVNPDFDYVRARDPASGRMYIVAAVRLPEIPGAVPKAKKAKKGAAAEPPTGGWQVRPLDLQREESGLRIADALKDVFSLPPWTSWLTLDMYGCLCCMSRLVEVPQS